MNHATTEPMGPLKNLLKVASAWRSGIGTGGARFFSGPPMSFPTADSNAAEAAGPPPANPLTEVPRAGARQLLTQDVEAEVEQWIADHAHLTDENGHRQVVRNGYAQPRQVVTGLGPIDARPPGPRAPGPPRPRPPR